RGAGLGEGVPPQVVRQRREHLRELEKELAERYSRSLLGRRLDVLVEGPSARPGFAQGTSCRYVPVVFRGHASALIRRRVVVRAVAIEDGVLVGEPEPELGGLSAVCPEPTSRRVPLELVAGT